MLVFNGFKINRYVRIGDQEPKNWDDFTEEEKKEISQKLNEQAAKNVALRLEK